MKLEVTAVGPHIFSKPSRVVINTDDIVESYKTTPFRALHRLKDNSWLRIERAPVSQVTRYLLVRGDLVPAYLWWAFYNANVHKEVLTPHWIRALFDSTSAMANRKLLASFPFLYSGEEPGAAAIVQ